MDKYIYGADTETLEGEPMTLQFYSEDCACESIHFVNSKSASKTFLEWCSKRKKNVAHVVYVHNLGFDLPEFLWGYHAKLIGPGGDFSFKIGSWLITGVYGSPTFCKLSNGHNLSITIVDSWSFFRGSLAKGAELFCPDLPKLKRVSGLGSQQFKPTDKAFCAYAMRDAEVSYHMGRAIEKMHAEWDIPQTVSVADMAATIFRRKFLSYDIPQPDRDVIDAALLSYHGGKNNITVESGWYENVTCLDISSAYPHAMHEMPAFSNVDLYKRYRKSARIRSVPEWGIYCVTGTLAECQWPVVFSHGFKPLHGRIDRIWIHGQEVNEALRSGELKIESIRGNYYDYEKDHQASAFRHFVETFYKLKSTETDPVLRYMQKLVLNSISGKLIQTRKRGAASFTDIDAGVTTTAADLIAGGMFHPFIASGVTAHTRGRIHRLEHDVRAIHTATDGVMSRAKNARPIGSGLGAITCEARDATVLMIRNKCYVIYAKKSTKTTPSSVFKGKHILKYALHGFQGNVSQLEKLIATNRRKYEVSRPNRLKESLKRGLTPNKFVTRPYTLKVGPLTVKR